MDKVIIDGVDVSGCEFAVKAINDNRIKCHCAKGLLQIAKMQEQPESIKSGLCENNPNCYYKQLQRLKAENERLKEESKKTEETAISLLNIQNELAKSCVIYKQALQEIKDIADRTDGNHPASVINMVSVIRHTINSVIGAEE